MTREQTRKLGIEFERRINEIDPRFKLQNKLTTDIIYSMLSEFQTQYIKGLYAIDDDIKSGTRKQSKIQDTTKTLVRHKILTPSKTNIDGDSNSSIFDFPSDYYSYIRSNSLVTKNYKSNEVLTTAISTPNDILKQNDIKKITNSYYNKGQIIRNPIVVLESQAGKYLNIPANKIQSLPDISGIKYQQRMLVANLGLLPLDFNIDTLYNVIKDDVYDVTGIQTEVQDIKSSGIVIIDEIKDKEYMKLLDNKRTVNLSYRTRYYKLKDAYDKLLEQQSKLEDYIKRIHQAQIEYHMVLYLCYILLGLRCVIYLVLVSD